MRLLLFFTDYCTNLVWTEVRQDVLYRFRKVLPSGRINTLGSLKFERKNTDFRSVLKGKSVHLCLYMIGKASTPVSYIVTAQN